MRIAIAGFGQEGKASYDYWDRDGNELVIVDEREPSADLPAGAETIVGPDAYSRLSEFDLIVRSPGVNPSKVPYGDAVWSATNEFFHVCPAPIIGVTGTKGKGTTSSFIANILEAGGRKVHLVGNIGIPALNRLNDISESDVVVYELSSFQLWDLKKSPHVAVVLMIERDHLDVHEGMEDYISAKANIVRHQRAEDIVVFNSNNEISSQIAGLSAGRKVEYPFDLGGTAAAVSLPGAHNLDNASAAVAATREYVTDETIIRTGLASFTGLPHRLQFVAEKDSVKFYDDSIATTPGSAIAAIRSFSQPKVLILGGFDKGADYTELIELCETTATKVLAIGSNGADIARLCSQLGVTCEQETGGMTDIVHKAFEIAQPGDVVVLSPAAASFDMFKSYTDRGDQFITAVQSLQS